MRKKEYITVDEVIYIMQSDESIEDYGIETEDAESTTTLEVITNGK